MQAPDNSRRRTPLFSARKRLFISSLLLAFLFPGLTWKQAAGCALLLLLFNTLILPWLDLGVTDSVSSRSPGDRARTGIVLYPISVLALIVLYRNHLHIAAATWAIMALGDGMATVVGLQWSGDFTSELSKLAAHVGAQSGSAAPTCGKPPAFPPMPHPSSSSVQAGKLSLPACTEEVDHDARPSERRSLSARQAAEPLVVADKMERNFDEAGASPGPTNVSVGLLLLLQVP